MPRPKKGKARAPHQAPEGGEDEGILEPIPEDPAGYEGWDNRGQGGEAWQGEETRWADGGGDDQGYAYGDHRDQWGQYPNAQAGEWPGDTPPAHYPHPQQEWVAPTTSPVNAPATADPASNWTTWSRTHQGAYGAPRTPRAAPQQHTMAPPQPTPPSRPRNNSGGNAGGTTSWQHWGAEAAANRYQSPPQTTGTPYGQQHRVAFASNDSYVPTGDRAEMTPQAQRMIFESILSSQGGAPKQPQQRSGRSTAQNSVHTSKQHKKSKRERRAQEQNPQHDWGGQQENPGWGPPDNSGWEREESRWPGEQQDTGWGEKEAPAWEQQWAAGDAGRDDPDGEGYADGDGWNDAAGRRNYRQTVSSAFVPAPTGHSPYPMPSRTMAYANGNAEDTLDAISPGLSRQSNTISDYANLQFLESYGEALKPVENAFFGRGRKARDRIHWQFPHDKDERVVHALEWLYDNAHGIGAFGLNKFLQTRERGALFINASYDAPAGIGPALDWLTYEDVVETRDRLLQESVGYYDPGMQVIVFVLLPSKTGNSLAMWRRKVAVPNSVRLSHLREIELAKAALRKDYPVLVDEIRRLPYRPTSLPSQSVPPQLLPPLKPKKKKKGFFRRLFRIFKIVW
ncbi:hypothetical protein EDB84DRAFT_1454684 [Lactarius hengduanensis]|nr:hypothetical protein EDB84DRAFT_1454684 [Lactarius hengduanensis]